MADTSPPPTGQQKSPLDVLEEILNQSKQASGDPAAGAATVPVGPTPEELAAQQQATQLAQAQAQLEQAKVRDEQDIKVQLTQLQQAYQSPQYQEAVRQKTEKQQGEDQQKSDSAGFEIKQIEHTKI